MVIKLPQSHKLMSICVYNRLDNITVVKISLSYLKQKNSKTRPFPPQLPSPTFQDCLL